MDGKVTQLMEMGASRTQAIAALSRYKDLDQAAERFFDGEFDGIESNEDDAPDEGSKRPADSGADSGDSGMDEDDAEDDNEDDVEDYADYDSEDGEKAVLAVGNVDPYAGIFFSKDRREEVIEVEEDPERLFVPSSEDPLEAMSNSEFMKGCPESGEQAFLFSLYDLLTNGSCACPSGCGYSVLRGKHQFFPLFPEFAQYIGHLETFVPQRCPRCSTVFCLACGEALHPGKNETRRQVLFHCSTLQGVILGVGLYMLDRLFDQQTSRSLQLPADKPPTVKKRKTEHGIIGSAPKGKGAPGGTGYAGDVKEDLSGQHEAQAAQQTKDVEMSNLFREIREFLPSLRRPGGSCASDYLVHPTTLAHLRRRFNRVCSTLLRNDSLTDMSDRSVLYYELFEWLSTVSNHEALASMMGMPIMVVHSRSLRSVNSKSKEFLVTYEGSAGPREILESIVIQAQAAIKGLEGPQQEDSTKDMDMTEEEKRKTFDSKGKEKARVPQLEENERLLNFCRRILNTRDAIDRSLRETKGDEFLARLKQSLPKVPGKSATDKDYPIVNSSVTKEELQKLYVDWATRSRFEYCDLSIPVMDEPADSNAGPKWKFFFTTEARLLVNSDLPRRSLAIAKELAVLTTNLPVSWDSSIFLRVDEARVDIIKALIIGPPGTPYSNGCYLFDIFLGASYNQSPPSVKYMTTNNGRFRFNPNLYADGKVCLSLLGTWSGPGWVAGKSTLLQVLISIQSMILCEEPYLNEPGWANGAGTTASQAYSANVRRMVVHTAMLGNLRSPPEPFGGVIRTHFKLKAEEISEQLDLWLQMDDKVKKPADLDEFVGGSARQEPVNLKADIAELKAMMKEL